MDRHDEGRGTQLDSAVPANQPVGSIYASMAYHPGIDKLVLFGGDGVSTGFGDTCT